MKAADKQQLKTVIITGGGTGIGYDTAKLLLETGGYRLALLGRNRARLEGAAQSLGGASSQISVFACDLKDSSQISRTVEKIAGTYQGIYGLVNNAGIYAFGDLSSTTEQSWDEAMSVNLKAPFLLCKAVSEEMAKNAAGGRIINVSSTAGILPNQSALAYSVSKAAIIHLTRSLAKELGKDGITVNCVCPGIVKSPLHESFHPGRTQLEEFYAKRGAALPLGRVGEARDVSGAIRYFLSAESGWVTGEVMVIDGGRLLL